MKNALIIGASRGIGREFVRQLLAAGWHVYATARDDAALAELRAAGAVALKADVSKPESLASLGWELEGTRLDLAVYVAGVTGPMNGAAFSLAAGDFDKVMHTNVLGAMQCMPLIAPMVEQAQGRFVFISSEMGSTTETRSSYGWVYRTSKAALNMAVHAAAYDYPKAVFLTLSPGWVRTEMGGTDAPLSVEESVTGMLAAISRLQASDSGKFLSHTGDPLPW